MRLEALRKEADFEDIKGEIERDLGMFESVVHACKYRGTLTGKIIFTNYRFIFISDTDADRHERNEIILRAGPTGHQTFFELAFSETGVYKLTTPDET